MGYSKSKQSVEKYREILVALSNATKDLSLRSSDPTKLAYKIREAIRVARLYPTTFPEFQHLHEKYTIRVKDDRVLFELKSDLITSPLEELANSLVMTFDDCTHLFEIIGSLIKHKPVEAIYPNAGKGENDAIPTDLELIYNWTSKNGYYINDTAPLTISRTETPESWKPQS